MEVTAKLNYLRMAPRKVRLVAKPLKSKGVNEVLRWLDHLPNRAGKPLAKLVGSAAANAKHNFGIEKDELYVKEIKVNQGPALKRYLPRAFGRADTIKKYSSHITLVLGTSDERTTKIKGRRAK